MIEPTDEMIAATMEAFNSTGAYGPVVAAVLAIVEKDYDVRPRASVCAETTPRLVGTGLHRCNLPGGHIGPHRSDKAVWEGEL